MAMAVAGACAFMPHFMPRLWCREVPSVRDDPQELSAAAIRADAEAAVLRADAEALEAAAIRGGAEALEARESVCSRHSTSSGCSEFRMDFLRSCGKPMQVESPVRRLSSAGEEDVPALVSRLADASSDLQRASVLQALLGRLQARRGAAREAMEAGVMEPLVPLAERGGHRAAAAALLGALARGSGLVQARVVRGGGLSVLAELAKAGLPGEKLAAVEALEAFAANHAQQLVEAGGLRTLARLAAGGTPRQRQAAKTTLLKLAKCPAVQRPAVLAALRELGLVAH
mmetsp:Transcript_37033/g.105866  ORF Transcript_37033/g.105866 Transcript_37033/m.105866 type:complete len:286 (+) Transcript_37033:76-933(+)